MGRRSYQPPRATSIGTPEAQLWASVLHQAMLEGFFGCQGGTGATLSANGQAISFLVAEHGDWADSRRRICGFLGIEDAAFTATCRAVFEGGPLPQVPGFETRSKKDLESQCWLYRAVMSEKPVTPQPRPVEASKVVPIVRPVQEPEPPALDVEPPTPMHEAIFAAMSQRTTTPIEVNEDGLLYWPIKAPDTGTFQGKPLPAVDTKQYRVMRKATRLRGGNLIGLHQCGDDWEDTLHDVAARYDLELVIFKDGVPVTEMTGETHLFLRPRP